MKFVADSMLGKLAKWLRVLGYDTHYQRFYRPGAIDRLLKGDRYLLSRHGAMANQYNKTVLLHADRVGVQLNELKDKLNLAPERSTWFSRCLVCNALLEETQPDDVRDNVPEYVFYNNMTGVRSCPSCGRYYWAGSHRTRMVKQLAEWGFTRALNQLITN